MKNFPIVSHSPKSKGLYPLVYCFNQIRNKSVKTKGLFYVLIIFLGFLLGLSPVVLNYVVDPYNMNKVFNLNMEKEKLSLKSHYPLWKIINYPKETTDTLILGDSRALALKDKYWHQLELSKAYNFAYGGATIDEIYDTFQHIKSNKAIKNIVLGIQLRSLSPHYKKAMNRVPEAISLAQNPLQYYSNGFVTQMSWKHVKKHYPEKLSLLTQRLNTLPLTFISSVHAGEFKEEKEDKTLKSLLDPKYCAECTLPIITQSAPPRIKPTAAAAAIAAAKSKPSAAASASAKSKPAAAPNSQAAVIAKVWQHLWPHISLDRQLPPSFEKQVTKNAKSDWQTFKFSSDYWDKLIKIAHWCDKNEIKLIFFIPPTIAEMQQQITNYGYSEANHKLRVDLSQIAPVVDFDFNNPVTQDLDNFNDAYHFNYKLAKSIIGELIQVLNSDTTASKQAHKRRENLACPISEGEINQQTSDQRTTVFEGNACRIWRKNHG